MKKFIFLSAVIFVCLLQAAVIDSFSLFRIKPDLVLVVVTIFSLNLAKSQAIALGLFAGILKDILMYPIFGINTLLFPLWAWLIINLSKKISIDNNILYLLLMFIVSILHNLATNIILTFLEINIAWYVALKVIVLESFYSSLAMLLVLKIFRTTFNPPR